MITNLCDHVEMAERIWSNFPERRVFDSALILIEFNNDSTGHFYFHCNCVVGGWRDFPDHLIAVKFSQFPPPSSMRAFHDRQRSQSFLFASLRSFFMSFYWSYSRLFKFSSHIGVSELSSDFNNFHFSCKHIHTLQARRFWRCSNIYKYHVRESHREKINGEEKWLRIFLHFNLLIALKFVINLRQLPYESWKATLNRYFSKARSTQCVCSTSEKSHQFPFLFTLLRILTQQRRRTSNKKIWNLFWYLKSIRTLRAKHTQKVSHRLRSALSAVQSKKEARRQSSSKFHEALLSLPRCHLTTLTKRISGWKKASFESRNLEFLWINLKLTLRDLWEIRAMFEGFRVRRELRILKSIHCCFLCQTTGWNSRWHSSIGLKIRSRLAVHTSI